MTSQLNCKHPVRDLRTLDKYLLEIRNRADELAAQAQHLLRFDLTAGNTVRGLEVEIAKAANIARTINYRLELAEHELRQIGGAE